MKMLMIHTGSLKKFRQLNGLKQKSVAKNLGVTQQAYAKLENAENITGERLPHLLKAMNSTLKDWNRFIKFLPPPRS